MKTGKLEDARGKWKSWGLDQRERNICWIQIISEELNRSVEQFLSESTGLASRSKSSHIGDQKGLDNSKFKPSVWEALR